MENPVVHVVDDDPAIRKALERSLGKHGYTVLTYASAESFLESYKPGQPACLVLDVRMPGMSGLELQERLSDYSEVLPIIFITGHGDIPMSVRAIKEGAIEFLEKPYLVENLLAKIKDGLERSSEQLNLSRDKQELLDRYQSLTSRECDVLQLLVKGIANTSNKEIARQLEISHRTVDDHRSRIMSKMQARSLPELVDMAKVCGVHEPDQDEDQAAALDDPA